MEETLELLQLAKEGDKEARDKIVSLNTGLVWSVARRFQNRGHELEDLFQIGVIGLLKCIDKFDLSYEVKFSTYAVPMITGEIKRFLRDDGMIKVSRSLKETAYKVKLAKDKLSMEGGNEPTIHQIADYLQISVEEIAASLESSAEIESLYQTIYQGDGKSIYMIDKVREGEDESESIVDRLTVQDMIEGLNEKEKQIIKLRYFESKTQTEIAKLTGISQVQVSRLEKKILLQMRKKLV
ncbi:MAG: RNA polymerase sporulation sigma factor SigF [Lachnospiraceae bacterium]|nr:RNA polymerase sporulation sigma factor SigF [Lachnospiraceae bacterium]MEE1341477.1 RNA polymerase sporulation sigma factor SigF [Lachnospiraceae bacterium]